MQDSPVPVRRVHGQTPGTGESFYRDAGEPVDSAVDASRPAAWARLRAIAGRSGSIELLGPAPFAAAQPQESAMPAQRHPPRTRGLKSLRRAALEGLGCLR